MLYIFEERGYLVSLYGKLDMTRHALNTSPPTHFFSNVHKKGIKEVFSSIRKTLANVWFSKTGKGQFGSYLISSFYLGQKTFIFSFLPGILDFARFSSYWLNRLPHLPHCKDRQCSAKIQNA